MSDQKAVPAGAPEPVGGVPDGTSYMVWLHAAKLAGTTVRGLLEDTLPVQSAAYHRAMADLAHRPETRNHPDVVAWVRDRASALEPAAVPARPGPPSCRPPSAAEQLLGAERVATTALVMLQDGAPEQALHLLVAAAHQVSCALKDFQDKQETKQTVREGARSGEV